MVKCPKCKTEIAKPSKNWRYSIYDVKMYKCTACGNQFRQYLRGNETKFVLSAHNGGLGPKQKTRSK